MSMDKAIKAGKEHRKPYTGAKAIARSCRNHGSDDWMVSNRLHKYRKKVYSAEEEIGEYIEEMQSSSISNLETVH